jgi:hypothetical protein
MSLCESNQEPPNTRQYNLCTVQLLVAIGGLIKHWNASNKFDPAIAAAAAQTTTPCQGSSCPTGTYKSGDYCKPFKSNSDQVIIGKSGRKCPTGFYKSGSYCKRMSSSDKEALPRESGGKCPTGWYKSGGYCVRQ